MPSKDLKVTLIGDDRTGSAFGSAGKNADGLGSKFAKLGKGIGLAFGGAAVAGIAGLGAALVQGGRDAASYQKIGDQVAQTIKSTGAAAGVTAGGLKQYAGQLESMSGVDEELILSGQNVLLTFTNVRNEVGKGNDIFDQASEAALNLSTTMGGDLVGANTLVGKALNDPVKGMAALRRAGVQLTQAQQDQIKAMVKSGDTMGAQKILLGELTTQFGGAAKAAGQGLTGSIARAKDAFQDMFRGIATALLPKLAELAGFFANRLMPGIKGIYDLVIGGDFTGALREAFGWDEDSAAVDFLFNLRDAFINIWPTIKRFGAALVDVAKVAIPVLFGALKTVGSAIGSVVGFFREHNTAARALGVIVGTVAGLVAAAWTAQAAVSTVNAAKSVIAWLTTATASTTSATIQSRSTAQIVVGWIAASAAAVANAARVVGGWVLMGAQSMIQAARMAAAWVIAMGPVGWVIAAVVGLVAVIVANWDTVVSWTKTAWTAVTNFIGKAWEWIKGAVSAGLNFLVKLFLNFTGPGLIIKHWNTIKNATSAAWNAVRSAVSGAWNAVTGAVSSGVSTVVSFVSGLPGKVVRALGNIGSLLLSAGSDLIRGFLNGIKNMAGAVADAAKNVAKSAVNGVKNFLGINSPSKVFHALGTNVGEGFVNGIAGMRPAVAAEMRRMADTQALGGLTGLGVTAGRVPTAATPVAGFAPAVSSGDSRASQPIIRIDNYNEARQSPYEVAQNLAFLGRTRG